jgi:hypothetical protein
MAMPCFFYCFSVAFSLWGTPAILPHRALQLRFIPLVFFLSQNNRVNMESAEEAVQRFGSKSGHHDITVDEIIRPALNEGQIRPVRR